MTTQERYSAYWGWCTMLGVEPADFDSWRKAQASISDLNFS